MIRIFMTGYSENKGGVESYIDNLMASLDKNKFEVILSMPEMLIDGKIWKRPQNRHNYVLYWLFWKKFYAETKIDVLYYNTCDVVSIDQLRFAKKAGVPVRIIHSHSSVNQQSIVQELNVLHRFTERHNRQVLSRYATHLFACSALAGKWLYDDRSFTLIKNGISLSKYRFDNESRNRIRKELDLKNEKLIGIIGRMAAVKNPLFALRVLKEILGEYKDFSAVFVGDGELREQLETEAKNVGLDKRIFFPGLVDNVNEWLSAMDCLVLTSLFEGLPFVLVEAQASGLPCVVSSTVSQEANISGELRYVKLDDCLDIWKKEIVKAANQPRYDANQKLIDAGYAIEDSAKMVESILGRANG